MPRRPTRPRAARPGGRPEDSDPGSDVAALLNLGPKSARWLADAGITTRGQMEKLGTIEVCRRVRQAGHPASVVLAYAIEGGLMGCHWNEIPWEFKQHLRAEFAQLRRKG